MKKWVTVLVIIAVVITFSSCHSMHKVTKDGAPLWTVSPPKDTRSLHYAVGFAKQSTLQMSHQRAEATAKDAIARWAETSVDNSLINFIQDAGDAFTNREMLEIFQSMSLQTVSIALRGVEIVERYEADDGTVWVLSTYPLENLKEAYRLKSEELERNYELIKAKLLIDYLEAELANYQ